MTKEKAVVSLHKIVQAVVETVRECGSTGAPAGILYAVLMSYGATLEQFETMMRLLVEAKKLRKDGQLYFAV